MNKKRVFVVSHKSARSVVRWISVNYWEVEEQIGVEEVKLALQFEADVRMVNGEIFAFSGKWSTRDPEEVLKEISMHGERFAREIVAENEREALELAANAVDDDHGTKTAAVVIKI